MKIKYIVLCLLLVLVGCQRDEEMEIVNATINNELMDPSYSSVSIRCNIKCNATISNVKAYVSTNQSFSGSKSHALTEMSKGVYTATIDGLNDGTTYYIRYEISNRWSSISLDKVSKFTTILGTIPTITTIAATDITQNQAVVGGIIKDNGGMAVTQHGVVYSTSSSPTVESGTKVDNQVDSATFTCTLRDLSFATTYYVRAYAINKKGTAYGEEVSFKTKSISAALDNISVTDVKSTSAIIKGALLHDGGEPITAMGICYGLTQLPTSANATVVNVESQGQSFSVQLSQLKKGTTYYARAFAKNKNGIAYSNEVSFNTLTELPTVVTTSISDVSYTSVTVSGNVTDGGGLEVRERGICYATNPSYSFTRVPDDDSGVGEYTCNLTGLQDGTTYYVRAYATNSKGYAYGEILSFTTKEKVMPTVKTTAATNISYNTATVGGVVQDDGGASVTQRGVCYSTSPNPTTVSDNTAFGVGATFTCNLTGLKDGTTYYVRAFATNAKGTAYGEQVTFTTKATTTATVATIPATNVSYHSATVGGQLINNGGIAVTESGVVYSTSQNPTTLDIKVLSERQSDEFTIDLTDLQDGTTYYVRAYAVNANGTAYGEEVSFTTKAKIIATITTISATNVSYTSATVGGNVTNDGGAAITERGVCYSTSANPTTANTKITSGSGTGSFVCNLTELQDGTTYYACAYAINEKGVAYGNEVSFTTKGKTIPTVTTNTPSEITYTQAMIQGSVSDDGGVTVTEKGICYSTSPNPTVDSNKQTNGSGIGTITCVFSDLQDGTTYYARAYAINALGVGYGNEISFTTIAYEVPQITIANPTKYSVSTATIDCEVTFDGGLEVTERGVCYSTTSNPTYSNSKVQNGSGYGVYSCELSNLSENTTYYVRAYAKNAEGIGYSREVSFTTRTRTYMDGYEYVDLGLSVKWATMNVGATKPEEYGDYFAWGETEPKDVYDWSTYKHCYGSPTSLNKYNTSSLYGRIVDGKTQLDLSDDAARANWGGAWRMPTDAEMTELREQCTWIWTTQNGVNGYKVTSKSNGNSIFLPAAGYRNDSSLNKAGSNGYYWSSSLNTDYPYDAWSVYFYSDYVSRGYNYRSDGRSVRPVCPQNLLLMYRQQAKHAK